MPDKEKIREFAIIMETHNTVEKFKSMIESITEGIKHPSLIFQAVDMYRMMEYYMPIMKKIVEPYIGEPRPEAYNIAYLETMYKGHLIDEMNGIEVDNILGTLLPVDIEYLRIYDVGGGLGYWSDKYMNLLKNPRRTIIEQECMIPELQKRNLDAITLNEFFNFPVPPKGVIIMGNFIHLFNKEEAENILYGIVKKLSDVENVNYYILIIEPTIGSKVIYGHNIKRQMRQMKGVESCIDSLEEIIFNTTAELSHSFGTSLFYKFACIMVRGKDMIESWKKNMLRSIQ